MSRGLACMCVRSTAHCRPSRRQLYGSVPGNRASLLTQLRNRHCWLATYAKALRFQYDGLCVWGEWESVQHVLLDCARLRECKKELRSKLATRSEAYQHHASHCGIFPRLAPTNISWRLSDVSSTNLPPRLEHHRPLPPKIR